MLHQHIDISTNIEKRPSRPMPADASQRGQRQQSECNQIDKNVHWPNHTREILVISKVMMKIVPSWWITG